MEFYSSYSLYFQFLSVSFIVSSILFLKFNIFLLLNKQHNCFCFVVFENLVKLFYLKLKLNKQIKNSRCKLVDLGLSEALKSYEKESPACFPRKRSQSILKELSPNFKHETQQLKKLRLDDNSNSNKISICEHKQIKRNMPYQQTEVKHSTTLTKSACCCYGKFSICKRCLARFVWFTVFMYLKINPITEYFYFVEKK